MNLAVAIWPNRSQAYRRSNSSNHHGQPAHPETSETLTLPDDDAYDAAAELIFPYYFKVDWKT